MKCKTETIPIPRTISCFLSSVWTPKPLSPARFSRHRSLRQNIRYRLLCRYQSFNLSIQTKGVIMNPYKQSSIQAKQYRMNSFVSICLAPCSPFTVRFEMAKKEACLSLNADCFAIIQFTNYKSHPPQSALPVVTTLFNACPLHKYHE